MPLSWPGRPQRIFPLFPGLLFLIAILGAAPAQETITTCAGVHFLSAGEASLGTEVVVTAVVTFFDHRTNSTLIIQDDSGGIYVNTQGIPFTGKPGDLVEITGITAPGDFAPVILLHSFRELGRGRMPLLRTVTPLELRRGDADCLRVSFRAQVRAVSFGSKQRPFNPPRLVLEFGEEGNPIHAHLLDWEELDPAALVDAEVEMVGIASGHFNDRRQILRGNILVQNGNDLSVIKRPLPPEKVPLLEIGQLFTYRQSPADENRVRFEGVVSGTNAPDWIAVQAGTSGILLQPAPLNPVQPGDEVMVVGYPQQRDLRSFMVGATIELRGSGGVPQALPLSDLRKAAGLQGCLVVVEGTLREPPALVAGLARLRLGTKDGELLVEVPDCPRVPPLWQTGAILRAQGVLLAEMSSEAMSLRFPQADRITVHVPGMDGVQVLSRSPWWTAQRLWYALGTLVALVALTSLTGWRLRVKARELMQRGRELAGAEFLRTTQLHEQLAVQHQQQLSFQAVLHERQRLAQELHDSMEQQFASLSLYAEAALAEKEGPAAPAPNLHGLRAFIEESRVEVRRCVWGLRARALEHGGLSAALQELARQHNAGAGTRLKVTGSGEPAKLDAAVENHLFRFTQEAVGNALKHAGATEIDVILQWSEQLLRLSVSDNGRGLPAGSPAPAGLRHRAKSLAARMTLTPVDHGGTRVLLELDLSPDVAPSIPLL